SNQIAPSRRFRTDSANFVPVNSHHPVVAMSCPFRCVQVTQMAVSTTAQSALTVRLIVSTPSTSGQRERAGECEVGFDSTALGVNAQQVADAGEARWTPALDV